MNKTYVVWFLKHKLKLVHRNCCLNTDTTGVYLNLIPRVIYQNKDGRGEMRAFETADKARRLNSEKWACEHVAPFLNRIPNIHDGRWMFNGARLKPLGAPGGVYPPAVLGPITNAGCMTL